MSDKTTEEPCPKCGDTEFIRDYVDIGVGQMPMPGYCLVCGFSEAQETEKEMNSLGLGYEEGL